MAANILADHNYAGANQSVNTDTIDIPSSKIDNVKKSIKNILESKMNKLSEPSQAISFKTLKIDLQIDTQLSNKTVLNLQGLYPENPNSNKNYFNVLQNTTEWEKLQYKKVTGSRLSALLGISSQSKFEDYWKMVSVGFAER